MKLYTLAALCFAPAAIYAVAASPSRPYIVRVSGAPSSSTRDTPHKYSDVATLPELMPKASRADLEGTLLGLCGEVMNLQVDDYAGEIACAQQQVKLYQEVEKEVEQELKQEESKKEKNL